MKCDMCGNQKMKLIEGSSGVYRCHECGREYHTMKIKHEYTGDVVCPWCGDVKINSSEFHDHFEEDCEVCGKKFQGHREVIVEYCTKKIGG
jgi:DNA-directed RNA polymerase subunit RPC12/RpoP